MLNGSFGILKSYRKTLMKKSLVRCVRREHLLLARFGVYLPQYAMVFRNVWSFIDQVSSQLFGFIIVSFFSQGYQPVKRFLISQNPLGINRYLNGSVYQYQRLLFPPFSQSGSRLACNGFSLLITFFQNFGNGKLCFFK